MTVNKYYEFFVSGLSVTPSTLYEDESVTISFRTDSWDQYNAYSNIPVQILYNGKVVYTAPAGYKGSDSFAVSVDVGYCRSETRIITVNID